VDRGLVDTAAQMDEPAERRIYGVAVGEVLQNCDQKNLGRVQVRLAWLPGYEPWARVAVLDGGTFFIPQVGDQVLVSFTNGDVLDPYVLGRVWNEKDPPPAREHGDPINKRIIRTPKGHEIAFDDAAKSVVVTTATHQRITLKSTGIEISADSTAGEADKTAITFDTNGNITIKAKTKIKLDAPDIEVNATSTFKITGPDINIG
jgi:phage baseplate assembly protein V